MCPRKMVTGDDVKIHVTPTEDVKSWKAGEEPQCHRTKTVHYTCGCRVTLGDYLGEKDAPVTCEKHHKPIAKVVTTEEFMCA